MTAVRGKTRPTLSGLGPNRGPKYSQAAHHQTAKPISAAIPVLMGDHPPGKNALKKRGVKSGTPVARSSAGIPVYPPS